MLTILFYWQNSGYLASKKFTDAFERELTKEWKYREIWINDKDKEYYMEYRISAFFDKRDMEVNDNNPYIILGKARNSAKKFLEENEKYKLNNGYIVELEIQNLSRSKSMYLTNKDPKWLLDMFGRLEDKIH